MIALYLIAIALANITIAVFGPAASIPVSFALIGLDFMARDILHARWEGRRLWPRMLALIGAGGALSAALNAEASQIAVASCAAFIAAGVSDTLVYQRMFGSPRILRANGSNLVSGLVDSSVFVLLVFGPLWGLILASYLAKIAGGIVWSAVFQYRGAWSRLSASD